MERHRKNQQIVHRTTWDLEILNFIAIKESYNVTYWVTWQGVTESLHQQEIKQNRK